MTEDRELQQGEQRLTVTIKQRGACLVEGRENNTLAVSQKPGQFALKSKAK